MTPCSREPPDLPTEPPQVFTHSSPPTRPETRRQRITSYTYATYDNTTLASHHLVALLDIKLGELVSALLESCARHDGQVYRSAEVDQVLLRQILDLIFRLRPGVGVGGVPTSYLTIGHPAISVAKSPASKSLKGRRPHSGALLLSLF